MSRPASHINPALDPNPVPERGPWITSLRLPRFLKRLLPRPIMQGLRQLRGMALSGDLPRHLEFEQSREDALASASITIVVPIHDAPIVTSRCLASLERYAPNSEIILVDDASRLPETLDIISHFSSRNGWKVVRHEKPLGHSAACWGGASLATRPYLCLLNSDTVVTPWCWRRLKEVFEQDQKIGVAGPSTSSAANQQNLILAHKLRTYWNDSQICAFAQRLLTECPDPVVMDLSSAMGFAFFIRRSLWEALKGFDHNLPDYGNEVELCNRVARHGYRIVWVRNAYIHHFGKQSYEGMFGAEGILARARAAEIYIKRKGSLNP